MGRGLSVIGFPNVSRMRDRHGKTRFRFRKTGLPSLYLPGLPGSHEFAAAYEAAKSGASVQPIGAGRTRPGSIDALAVAAYASADWAALAETTRRGYRGIMERMRKEHGDKPVAALTSPHLLAMRDKIPGKPARNNFIKAMRWFFRFAVERGMRKDNPAASIKKIKYQTAGYHTWTESEVTAFEAHWAVGTKQRLGMDLLLYTGQRSADVRVMGRQSMIGESFIRVRQSKGGSELEIPIHSRLAASLATVPKDQMLFLPTQYGPAFTQTGFYNWMKDACRDAGVPECSPHGLRKCIATRLADGGATHAQIMAITGHKNPKEVQTYIQARDQRRLATAAMAKLDTEQEQNLSNPADRLAK